jgi:outer membrane protein assembly factor BamB
MRYVSLFSVLMMMVLVGGCDAARDYAPSWLGGKDAQENAVAKVRDPNRVEIIRDDETLEITEGALDGLALSQAEVPTEWTQEGGGAAQFTGHMKGSLLKSIRAEASAGEGNDWLLQALAPSPVVNETYVFAMDGRGVISAHMRADIGKVAWVSDALSSDSDLLAGGLAVVGESLYAVTGEGMLAAINAKTGAKQWVRTIGEPVRSSLRVVNTTLFVTTAESRLLAYDATSGNVLWEHRGVSETTNLFGGASPVLTEGDGVLVAYASGELFRLQRDAGEMVWSDSLIRPRRTLAAGLFAGVDATPIVRGRIAIAAASSGLTIADDVVTGLRMWELPVGTTHSPWVDESISYIITEDAQLAALTTIKGEVGWVKPLVEADQKKEARVRYYGPYLIHDTVVALTSDGVLTQFSALDGKKIRHVELVDSLVASPAFAGNSAYLLGTDATLYQVQ